MIPIILATRRLDKLLRFEDWPYNLGHKFRKAVGFDYNIYSELVGTNEFSKMLACPYCNSIWIALVLLILRRTSLGKLLVSTLAASQASIYLYELEERWTQNG